MTLKVVPILGFWHPIKVAAESMWKHFLPTVFGPAFHCLFPHSKIYKKPKLITLFSFLNLLSLSYQYFKNTLDESLESVTLEHQKITLKTF